MYYCDSGQIKHNCCIYHKGQTNNGDCCGKLLCKTVLMSFQQDSLKSVLEQHNLLGTFM